MPTGLVWAGTIPKTQRLNRLFIDRVIKGADVEFTGFFGVDIHGKGCRLVDFTVNDARIAGLAGTCKAKSGYLREVGKAGALGITHFNFDLGRFTSTHQGPLG